MLVFTCQVSGDLSDIASWWGKLTASLTESGEGGKGSIIPGNAEFKYCEDGEGEGEGNGLLMESVNLKPYPPVIGRNVTITAKGFLNETINQGAKVHLEGKLGWITPLNEAHNLCEVSKKQLGWKCPIPVGPIEITKEVLVPTKAPHGVYEVTAKVTNDDGSPFTCIVGKINFLKL